MNHDRSPSRVLILCTGNSARSILAEYLLRVRGRGRFETYSAGSRPTGRVNPLALSVLREEYGIVAWAARSKSWDEFRDSKLDLVITVCGNAEQLCPTFPGAPLRAHFGSPDPADDQGSDAANRRLFREVAAQIARRVDALCALADDELTPERLAWIGELP